MSQRTVWSDEDLAILKRMWDEGKTALVISKAIGGKSRSSVLAKARRLNLDSRASGLQKKVKAVKEGRGYNPDPAPRAPRLKKVNKTQSERELIANTAYGEKCDMVDLKSGECCWPVGDPRDKEQFGFCAAPKVGGKVPYCFEHANIARQ